MSGRSRHGLHVVREADAPAAQEVTPDPRNPCGHPFVTFQQQSLVLAIAGMLNAETAGRLRMYLSMVTADGGPQELLLDLSDVVAVDEAGMAPVFEADELLGLRSASLRLAAVSASVAHFLADVRCDRALTAPAFDERPDRGED